MSSGVRAGLIGCSAERATGACHRAKDQVRMNGITDTHARAISSEGPRTELQFCHVTPLLQGGCTSLLEVS